MSDEWDDVLEEEKEPLISAETKESLYLAGDGLGMAGSALAGGSIYDETARVAASEVIADYSPEISRLFYEGATELASNPDSKYLFLATAMICAGDIGRRLHNATIEYGDSRNY